jgi:AraC family transcriptional regulator
MIKPVYPISNWGYSVHIPGTYRQLYQQRIDHALDFIDHHLSESLDLSSVAQAAGFSAFHFHRIFSAMVGENLQDYINRLRMEKAANLLEKSGRVSMTEIAFLCGFHSSSAFSRSFKKYFGVTASDYCRQPIRPIDRPNPLEELRRNPFPLPEVRVILKPEMHLAVFRGRRGYEPESIAQVWMKMFQWAGQHHLSTEPPHLTAIAVDDPIITPPHKCRYFAGLVVPEGTAASAGVSFMDYPRHLCAVCRLACSAEQIQPAYHTLYRQWLPDSGFEMDEMPPYEVYFDAPDLHPESPYVFDLCVPIRAV